MIGWYIQAKKIPMITPYIESIRKEMLTYRESEQENTYRWLINGKYIDESVLQILIEQELTTKPLQLRLESNDGSIFCEGTIRKGTFKDWFILKWNQLQDKISLYTSKNQKYKKGDFKSGTKLIK